MIALQGMTQESPLEPLKEPLKNQERKEDAPPQKKSERKTPAHYANSSLSIEPDVKQLVQLLAAHTKGVKYSTLCESARDLLASGIEPTHDDLTKFSKFWGTCWQSKDQPRPYPSQVLTHWGDYKSWLENPTQTPDQEFDGLIKPLLTTFNNLGRDTALKLLNTDKYKPIKAKMRSNGIGRIDGLRAYNSPEKWSTLN